MLAALVVSAALCPSNLIAGPARTMAGAGTASTFYIGETPFKFIGGFLPGWHWGYGDETADLDQIQTARATGITVMHLMLPQFETPLGVHDEAKLQRLDLYLDNAYKNNVYVMISFIQAYSETLVPTNPYYNSHSIEGIIKNQTLHDGFRNRIAKLVGRQNTVNGRYYKDDPVILAWIVCDEPVSAPFNYPSGLPDITLDELTNWFKEMASYIKDTLGAHQLVSVYAQPAIQEFFGGGSNYRKALSIPEFDFVYMEDAGLDVISNTVDYTCGSHDPAFDNEQFQMDKPVVFLPAFTSGCWDKTAICHDYTLQGNDLNEAIGAYFSMGAAAALVQNWGSDLYTSLPDFDQCFVYTDSYTYTAVTERLLARSQAVNPGGYPTGMADFVTVRYTLSVVNSGGGTVTSPSGIECGSTCSAAFLKGAEVTLTAAAADGYRFTSWSGCTSTSGPVCTVDITGTREVTATFTHNTPPGPAPVISTISPASGGAGTAATLSGKHFGTTQSSSSVVTFGGVTASITSWSDTKILCTVPAGVAVGPASVVVTTDAGGSSSGKAFTVKPPLVSGVSPSSGAIGSNVSISGNYFGATRGSSTVTFGGIQASVITWTGKKITCTVPGGVPAGPVPVAVTIGGVNSNSTKTFTIKPPLVSGVSPSSGAIGMAVTISGNYFGAQSPPAVTFSGVQAAVTAWTNTKITCTVPAGASTGPVAVTTAAGSNSTVKTFTLRPPVLSSISPSSGQIQDTVTITGSYFGSVRDSSRVIFPNDKEASIIAWTNTKITCTVPMATMSGLVVVTTGGGSSKGKMFTVNPPPP